MNRKLYFALLILFASILPSCKNPSAAIVKVDSLDIAVTPIKISIEKLVFDFKIYQGKYIETKGVFYDGLEEFAIYTQKGINGERDGFWLNLNHQLSLNQKIFDKVDGREIIVRGKIDTANKGHLGLYLATIKDIYYFEY